MLFVDNQNITDARVNLALEEHVLRERLAGEDCVLFYVNAPAIIIGRNQNTIEEIDPDVVAAASRSSDASPAAAPSITISAT